MILSVEPIGSLVEVSSPASTSPLFRSASAHARASTPGSRAQATEGQATHPRIRASATQAMARFFGVAITDP